MTHFGGQCTFLLTILSRCNISMLCLFFCLFLLMKILRQRQLTAHATKQYSATVARLRRIRRRINHRVRLKRSFGANRTVVVRLILWSAGGYFVRVWIWRAWKCNMNWTLAKRVTPPWDKMWPRLTRLPFLADRATHPDWLPHLLWKHDQIKMS